MVSVLTVGINTYQTRAEADSYLDDSARGAPWKSVAPADKDRSLLSAFRLLEKETWLSTKTDINRLATAVINAAGTGYAKNDILTVAGGTFGVAARIQVLTVAAGVIATIALIDGGTYTVDPTELTANIATGGAGSGATFTITIADQTAEQPREALVDCNANAIASNLIAGGIGSAQIELAFDISQDVDVETEEDQDSLLKSAGAGSAKVEFFRQKEGPRFSPIVHEYLRCFLGGSSLTAPVVGGTATESRFDDGDRYCQGEANA